MEEAEEEEELQRRSEAEGRQKSAFNTLLGDFDRVPSLTIRQIYESQSAMNRIRNKLKLLKDADFKRLHRYLPVNTEHADDIEQFEDAIKKDVEFLRN